jgi:hypothetical protein
VTPAAIVLAVSEAGYRFDLAGDRPQLVPEVKGACLPDDVRAALFAARADVVRYLTEVEECSVCGRECEPDDKPRLMDPAFCDRGGARGCRDAMGVWHQWEARCPFK